MKLKLEDSKETSRKLILITLMCVITGMLYMPGKETFIAESKFSDESKAVYQLEVGTEERASQEAKASEANEVRENVLESYSNSINPIVRAYMSIDNYVLQTLVLAIAIIYCIYAVGSLLVQENVMIIFAIARIIIGIFRFILKILRGRNVPQKKLASN